MASLPEETLGDQARIPLATAKQKCYEENSSFVRVETVEHICLEPIFLGRLITGVQLQLEKKLMKYSEELEGVIVTYDKLQMKHKHGRVVGEEPSIHFDIKVEYIVFRPTINCKLVGVVNKIGDDHIGLLVHGSFNAAIASSNRRNGLRDVEIGTKIIFRVVGVVAVGDVLLIKGAVNSDKTTKSNEHCNSSKGKETKVQKETSSSIHNQKTKQRRSEAEQVVETGMSSSGNFKTASNKRTKKHSFEEIESSEPIPRKKIKEERVSSMENNYNSEPTRTDKKHKKKKKKEKGESK